MSDVPDRGPADRSASAMRIGLRCRRLRLAPCSAGERRDVDRGIAAFVGAGWMRPEASRPPCSSIDGGRIARPWIEGSVGVSARSHGASGSATACGTGLKRGFRRAGSRCLPALPASSRLLSTLRPIAAGGAGPGRQFHRDCKRSRPGPEARSPAVEAGRSLVRNVRPDPKETSWHGIGRQVSLTDIR